MAGTEEQEERRGDTVAIPRSTWKAITWAASVAALGIAGFVWGSGTKIDDVKSDVKNALYRIEHLEDFATAGKRFTRDDGNSLEKRIDKVEKNCELHREEKAHREQVQLNREILWRIDKLERQSHSSGSLDYLQGGKMK